MSTNNTYTAPEIGTVVTMQNFEKFEKATVVDNRLASGGSGYLLVVVIDPQSALYGRLVEINSGNVV